MDDEVLTAKAIEAIGILLGLAVKLGEGNDANAFIPYMKLYSELGVDTDEGERVLGRANDIMLGLTKHKEDGILLTSLVVKEGTTKPSSGYYKYARSRGFPARGDDDVFFLGDQIERIKTAFRDITDAKVQRKEP